MTRGCCPSWMLMTASMINDLANRSSVLRSASLSAIGMAITFAIMAPYSVVSSAIAMAGAICLGSLIDPSIWTRPISVPIIPIAGAASPIALKIACPSRWRFKVSSRSFVSIERTTSGSWPSTTRLSAFLKNSSETSASSRASKPLARA